MSYQRTFVFTTRKHIEVIYSCWTFRMDRSIGKNETIFSAINLEGSNGNSIRKYQCIFHKGRHWGLRSLCRMTRLVDQAQVGKVSVELQRANVEDVISSIAVARPWTMSWSSVLNYLNNAHFHQLARACSIHGDTLHFGYSMNWSTDTFRSNIIDLQRKELTDVRKRIIDAANQSIATIYNMNGWEKFCRLPPPTNPINMAALSFLNWHVARSGAVRFLCCTAWGFV